VQRATKPQTGSGGEDCVYGHLYHLRPFGD
jgi:hypothetical protein